MAKWNETIFNTLWGPGIVTLAVAGGLTRTLGNRIIMPLGVVGGLVWCLAAATIAFTDRFDPLFPIAGSLIPVWAVAVGVMWGVRRPDPQPPRSRERQGKGRIRHPGAPYACGRAATSPRCVYKCRSSVRPWRRAASGKRGARAL